MLEGKYVKSLKPDSVVETNVLMINTKDKAEEKKKSVELMIKPLEHTNVGNKTMIYDSGSNVNLIKDSST